MQDQSPQMHIPLLSHDKPLGRAERRFTAEDLASPLMPEIRKGDFLMRMEEDATGLFKEDDILLVRPAPDAAPVPGMILVTLYDDAFWPERVLEAGGTPVLQTPPEAGEPGSHYRVERVGYVLWSMRDWPQPQRR